MYFVCHIDQLTVQTGWWMLPHTPSFSQNCAQLVWPVKQAIQVNTQTSWQSKLLTGQDQALLIITVNKWSSDYLAHLSVLISSTGPKDHMVESSVKQQSVGTTWCYTTTTKMTESICFCKIPVNYINWHNLPAVMPYMMLYKTNKKVKRKRLQKVFVFPK